MITRNAHFIKNSCGYCPNVEPVYLKGSMPVYGSDHNNNEIGDSSSSDDVSTNSCESSTLQSKSPIFKRKTSEVMEKKKKERKERYLKKTF